MSIPGEFLRPWLDGNTPVQASPSRLLGGGRADVDVRFIELVDATSARVHYPADSSNEVVVPVAEGHFFPDAVCPGVLGADGRIAVVYPPLAWPEESDNPVLVGDAVVLADQTMQDHATIMGELEGTVADLSEHNRDVVDPFIVDANQKLSVELPAAKQAAQDAQSKALEALTTGSQAIQIANLAKQQAEGAVWVGSAEPPFEARVPGQVWLETDGEDRMVGMWVLRDASAATPVWDQYAMLTGLLIVPGDDGTPTIIDQTGMTVGTVMADSITGNVLAANSVGAKQLVIGEISRQHLDGDVDGVLAEAEEWANRVVILPDSITISKSIVGSQQSLTALRLEATRISLIVDNKPIAYLDSERDLMSIGNAIVRDSLQVGEHQVRRIGQNNITVFQWVGV